MFTYNIYLRFKIKKNSFTLSGGGPLHTNTHTRPFTDKVKQINFIGIIV